MSKISVILPVYNSVETLPAAIESVLRQSFEDFEFLILDDGSREDVASVVGGYSDSRLHYRRRENRGLGATLNELIEWSQCDLVARMDADDVCFENRLSDQMRLFESQPEVVMAGGQIEFLAGNEVVPAFVMPTSHEEILTGLLDGRFPICHPALMFRRAAAIEVGGYRVHGLGEDLDFFLRMSEQGRLANLQTRVLKYRIHQGSSSVAQRAELDKQYAFAIENACRRRKGASELSFREFMDQFWSKRTLWQRFSGWAGSLSQLLYRRAIISRGEGRSGSSLVLLVVSAALRPVLSWRRMSELISLRLGRRQ